LNSIGLFGGTFNPIHLGHLQVAEEVRKGFGLEKIIFIPSAIPPHKGVDGLADAKDRYSMIVDAISSNKDFVVSDAEIHRKGPSYTIDTVLYFKNKYAGDTDCYLIVGLDAFLEIDTWRTFQELFNLIPFIVMTRPLADTRQPDDAQTVLENFIKSRVDHKYWFSHHKSCFCHPAKKPIFLVSVTPIDISSTGIRNRIKRGLSINHLVPESVEMNIQQKGLYV
jgi:nicotinate-nucleotide adenylyltransferase